MDSRKIAVELWQSPVYRQMVEIVESNRPLPPRWDFKENNVEEMKHRSAKLEMFEVVMSILKPRTGETS